MSLINGTFPPQAPVVTQGRKASGTIAKLGPGSTPAGRRATEWWSPPAVRAALDSLTADGRLVGVGMSAESPAIGPTPMFGLTRKLGAPPACGGVLGHLGYQNVDIEILAKLVSHARLDLSRSVSEIVSLEELPLGIEQLQRQDGNPTRILVKPRPLRLSHAATLKPRTRHAPTSLAAD